MGWGCLAMVAVTPLSVMLRGAVLQQLWLWFIVPFGVVAIPLPWALGLSVLAYLIVGMPQMPAPKKGEDPRDGALKYCAMILLGPIFGYLGGLLWHSFM